MAPPAPPPIPAEYLARRTISAVQEEDKQYNQPLNPMIQPLAKRHSAPPINVSLMTNSSQQSILERLTRSPSHLTTNQSINTAIDDELSPIPVFRSPSIQLQVPRSPSSSKQPSPPHSPSLSKQSYSHSKSKQSVEQPSNQFMNGIESKRGSVEFNPRSSLSFNVPKSPLSASLMPIPLSPLMAPTPIIQASAQSNNQSGTQSKPHAELLMQEFVQTEQTYLTSLTIAQNAYHNRLLAYQSLNHPIIDQDDVSVIFTNISTIHSLNSEFYEELKSLYNNDQLISEKSAQLMVEYANKFSHVYPRYVCGHDASNQRLQSNKKKSSEFDLMIKVTDLCERCRLEDLLIAPVQRVPRYLLLLKGVCSSLTESHERYQSFNSACQAMSTLASDINASLHSQASYVTLSALASRIADCPFPLLTANRRHLLDGVLRKKFANRAMKLQQWKKYWFLLFNDVLLYTTCPSSGTAEVKAKHALWLNECAINRIGSNQFEVRGAVKAVLLECENEDEREKWVLTVDQAITEARENKPAMSKHRPSAISMQSVNRSSTHDLSYFDDDDDDSECSVNMTPSPNMNPLRRATAPPILNHCSPLGALSR